MLKDRTCLHPHISFDRICEDGVAHCHFQGPGRAQSFWIWLSRMLSLNPCQNHALKLLRCMQVAMGFIKIANATMCRPIQALTQMRGYDVAQHVLACFGGAGGQHACAIARSLGMKTIFVHHYSGILSAVGIGLADVVMEEQVSNIAQSAAWVYTGQTECPHHILLSQLAFHGCMTFCNAVSWSLLQLDLKC